MAWRTRKRRRGCRHRYRSRSDKPDISSKEEMSQGYLDHLSHGPNGPNSNESLEWSQRLNLDHLSGPISAPVHLPIYRSKTKYGIIRSIDMTWTIRLRYRKPSSIESDIGGGPIDPDIGSKDQMDRWTVAMVPEQIGPPGERTMFGTIRCRKFFRLIHSIPPGWPIPIPYGNLTDIKPIVDRYGKQSAPECRRAFCCHIPERIPAIKNNQEQTR